MILNLASVLFHLLFYQYLIFRLLIVIRDLFFTRHSQQNWLTCTQQWKVIHPEHSCACLGSEGYSPLFLMKARPAL